MIHDVQFVSEGRSMAFVRVSGHDHAAIGYALNAGASIVVPQVDTVEQARHIVSAAKYGSRNNGTRSAPPCRLLPGFSGECQPPSRHRNPNRNSHWDQNLDAILTAIGEQIDSVWLGSLNVRVSMSLPGFWGAEPEWQDAVALYESTLAKYNKLASGLATRPDEMKREMARGRSFIATGSDLFALMGQVGELAFMRQNFPQQDYKGV